MANKPLKIVIPDDFPVVMSDSAALIRLQHERPGIIVDTYTDSVENERQLIDRIYEAHTVVSLRSDTPFTRYVLESCRGLVHLALWGTIVDHVDAQAAFDSGIVVSSTPGVTRDSVAEHALALALALAHKIPELDWRVRNQGWPQGILAQLCGKIMGVIGAGAIGRRMIELATGIGMKVMVMPGHDYTGDPDYGWTPPANASRVDFETLLQESDVISLHLRYDNQTRRMLGREEFALMKAGALFVNTASGKLVDEYALAEALRNQTIAGAALDVFDKEPIGRYNPLRYMPNVILSPHIAAVTKEALDISLNTAVDNVFAFIDNQKKDGRVRL